ncbi:MAG: four helix bundle protein [Candidatus Omnitrophica bacterium]|nr:four helix bundle protein [Candidatus Omnitrophota bacterium]
MSQITNSKPALYNLEERTLSFTKSIIEYIENLPKSLVNIEIARQLMRSAGSIGANYIEANESLSKRDFVMRVKISKKEAKESNYWLKLSQPCQENLPARQVLIQETTELMKIFGAIIEKSK